MVWEGSRKGSLERRGTRFAIPRVRAEAAGAVWNSRKGLGQRNPNEDGVDHAENGQVVIFNLTAPRPKAQTSPYLSAATSTSSTNTTSQGLNRVQVFGWVVASGSLTQASSNLQWLAILHLSRLGIPQRPGEGGGGTGTCSPQHLDTWPHPESGLQPLVLPPGREKPELQKAEQGWDRHQAKKPYGGGNRGFGESNSFKPEPSFYLKFIVMGSTQEGMKGREHAGDTGTR